MTSSPAPVALTLPRLQWGPARGVDGEHASAAAPRHALLVHGLGSSAQTMWRLGEGLAELGWSATAVDLRGHGGAPRASRYRIADLATDLAATAPEAGGAWDLVVAHSIGAAAAVVAGAGAGASASGAGWARRLVLLDPTLVADKAVRDRVLAGQLASHAGATVEQTAADNPRWHPLDVELRVGAVRAASRFALEHAVLDNPDWDVTDAAAALTVPTLVIAGDAAFGAMFVGAHADAVLRSNSRLTAVTVEGAGHNVHRDDPEAVLEHLYAVLSEG